MPTRNGASRLGHHGKSDGRIRSGYLLKRPWDVVVGTIGMMIAMPLWVVFFIAIKLEDRGPFFFTQERWGKDKTRFRVYKIRTMVPNAEEIFGNIQAQEHDPRVTRVGKFLRATSLDESPQLINIVRGDMSWVGPRALPINEVQTQEAQGDLPDEAVEGIRDPLQAPSRAYRNRPSVRSAGTYLESKSTGTMRPMPTARAC